MFRRLTNVIRGFVALFIGGVEKSAPEALLEVEKENLRKQIANYNQGLAAHAGMCERLMAQVKKLEREDEELRAKATANLRAGNRESAGQYALRLQTVGRELTENRAQLAEAETTYRQLVTARDASIQAAKAKIEALKSSLNELKIQRATAELGEMASGMITSIGGSGDTLNRLHEMVEEERQKAAGRSRVARDSLDLGDLEAREREQKAMAEIALADFAAREGIALEAPAAQAPGPGPGPDAPPPKRMGPQSEGRA
ncbi:MAG: PspA/IM30 family protein [Verrucomicrobiae bacterium]|nr:PspA/IM30 family protein [Verrucomicrobiae bacterium]